MYIYVWIANYNDSAKKDKRHLSLATYLSKIYLTAKARAAQVAMPPSPTAAAPSCQ